MPNARTINKIKTALAISCLTAALALPNEARAATGGIQSCTVGATCKIGEFLFDDSSTPIAGASCTITSNYPDNSAYLTAQAMSGGGSDGWYYYELTTPATTGVYPTKVCCTTSGDTLCIDKSFESASASSSDPSSIASAVWSFSGRTLSSFGTLVTDIWSRTTRTLTGADLSSGKLASQDDVTSVRNNINNLSTASGDLTAIKNTVNETRLLIEKVVNKPIIQNVLEDTSPDISAKLQDTRAMANQIYVNSQYLTSQSAVITASWNKTDGKALLSGIIELGNILGEQGDSSSASTLFGQVNWIRDSWNWDEAESLYNALIVDQKIVADLKSGLVDYQKDPGLYATAKLLVKNFVTLEKIIGTVSDTGSQKTLFAKIKVTSDLATNLDDKSNKIGKVLAGKDEINVNELTNQVLALNKIPGAASALTKVTSEDAKSTKNLLLGLKGIIDSNKKLMALGAGKTLVNVWLEMGSIIFKTLATNPSTLVSQKVEVKYYLPVEIKQEDIVKTDAGLEVQYDSEKDQLYVAGTFVLSPGQTRTFSVETKDIWQYSESELNSLRVQVSELYKPLEHTAYYAQGVSLKTDIDATLDRMTMLQGGAITPEDKIKAYRENTILKKSVDDKLAGMKDLVTQASGAGSLLGFVGGAQTIAVWGLIIVIAAGFIFMTVYMRTIIAKGKHEAVAKKTVSSGINPLRFVAVMLVSSLLGAAVSGVVASKLVSKNYEDKLNVLGEKTQNIPSQTQSLEPAKGGEDIVKVVVPYGIKVSAYKDASGSALISTLATSSDVVRLDKKGDYVQISLSEKSDVQNKPSAVWVSKSYIKDGSQLPDDTNIVLGNLIVIGKTPTDWLRVRDSAGISGEEIGKVNSGEKYQLVSERDGWYQIVLSDGSFGWVSGQYSSQVGNSE